jgi:hypothetical protein
VAPPLRLIANPPNSVITFIFSDECRPSAAKNGNATNVWYLA